MLAELVVICGGEIAVVGVTVFVDCAPVVEVNAAVFVGLDGVAEATTDVASSDVVEGAIVVVLCAVAVVFCIVVDVVSADVFRPAVVVI